MDIGFLVKRNSKEMEYIVYKVHAERKVTSWDYCDSEYEIVLDDLYSSKVAAIRKAQQLFDRRKADWVRVYKLSITNNGMHREKKFVYNKFRK